MRNKNMKEMENNNEFEIGTLFKGHLILGNFKDTKTGDTKLRLRCSSCSNLNWYISPDKVKEEGSCCIEPDSSPGISK